MKSKNLKQLHHLISVTLLIGDIYYAFIELKLSYRNDHDLLSFQADLISYL